MDSMTTVNIIIWIFAIILIGFSFVQAALFVRQALRFNKKHELYTKEDLMSCAKTGLIATIAPGVNTVFLGISLLAMMGSGYSFLRLGVIGNPILELMVVQYGSSTAGIDIATTTMTPSLMTYMVFCGCIGTAAYVIAPIFTLRPIEMAGKSKDGKPNKLVTKILPNATLSVMAVLAWDYISSGAAQATGYIASFAIALVVYFIISKGKKGLMPWALLFSTVIGVIAAQIAATIIA